MTVVDAYPLAALQAGMVYHAELRERNATFHDVSTTTLDGRFDLAALSASLADLVSRHPVLRTSFDLTEFSEPLQLVHAEATIPIEVLDWTGEDDTAARLREWRTEEHFRPYDLTTASLVRITVQLLAENRFALSIGFHHAILDGWSVASLVTELLRRYAARLAGDALPVEPLTDTFAGFVAAERAAIAADTTVAYWQNVVADMPTSELPAWPGAAEPDGVGDRLVVEFEPARFERLERTANRLGVPLRAVLLAAHQRVVGLLTGKREVVTGVVTHGRPETESGGEVAGLFLNTVPVRADLDQPSWPELIRAADRTLVELLPHRRFPLFEIQRLAGRSPIFHTAFDFHDFHVYDALDESAVRIVEQDFLETTDIPFTAIFARSRTESGVTLSYHRGRFTDEQIAAIGGHYLAVLDEISGAGDPRKVLRTDENLVDGGPADDPLPLHACVARWAAETPNAPAVLDAENAVTFADLWRRVCGLAGKLKDAGVRAESVVAVGIPRSVDSVVAVLAVLQAGAVVLPLDLDHPVIRLRELIDDAAPSLLVTRPGAETFDLPTIVEGAPGAAEPAEVVQLDNAAAVIYTSGSTGRAKGVLLTHRSATQFPGWHGRAVGLTGADRMAHRAPASTDGLFVELSMAYAVGAAVVAVPTEVVVDADAFADIVDRHRITAMYLVPSLIAVLAKDKAFERCPSLRVVVSGGEALPRAVVESFADQTNASLHNIYGPTEIGVAVASWAAVSGKPDAPVPIGRPSPGVRLHILDWAGQPVPIGTVGEVFAESRQIARGYLGHPGRTAEKFGPATGGGRHYRTGDWARWLPDGQIEFTGRADDQVKIRGVRIELAEVENRLAGHPSVARAVARVAGETLVAYVGWSGEPDEAAVRAYCVDRLPAAMVPARFVTIDDFPMLPNGKIDRAALPAELPEIAAEFVPPGDLVASRLQAIWEEVLQRPSISLRDDFFALGGHSLSALRLVMRIRREFGVELPVGRLLSHPTIEELAAILRTPARLAPNEVVVPLRTTGSRIPIFFIHALGGQVFRYRKLAMLLGDDQPAYGIASPGFSGGQPHGTMRELVNDYAARIIATRPGEPVVLAGFCVGGNLSLEVARGLRERGVDVPLVVTFFSEADDATNPVVHDDTTLMLNALTGSAYDVDRSTFSQLSAEERLASLLAGATAAGALDPGITDVTTAQRLLAVYRAHADALRGFVHPPYDGDFVLMYPVDGPTFEPGWENVVTGKLEIRNIPGSWLNIAEEPVVVGTAAAVREVLDRVNRGR